MIRNLGTLFPEHLRIPVCRTLSRDHTILDTDYSSSFAVRLNSYYDPDFSASAEQHYPGWSFLSSVYSYYLVRACKIEVCFYPDLAGTDEEGEFFEDCIIQAMTYAPTDGVTIHNVTNDFLWNEAARQGYDVRTSKYMLMSNGNPRKYYHRHFWRLKDVIAVPYPRFLVNAGYQAAMNANPAASFLGVCRIRRAEYSANWTTISFCYMLKITQYVELFQKKVEYVDAISHTPISADDVSSYVPKDFVDDFDPMVSEISCIDKNAPLEEQQKQRLELKRIIDNHRAVQKNRSHEKKHLADYSKLEKKKFMEKVMDETWSESDLDDDFSDLNNEEIDLND